MTSAKTGEGSTRFAYYVNQFKKRQAEKRDRPIEQDQDNRPIEQELDGIDSNERRMITILQYCLLGAIAFFCVQNVRPYIGIVESWASEWKPTGLYLMLSGMPLIGWLLTSGVDLAVAVIATVLWASLQLLELLPSFMMDSAAFLLSALRSIQNWTKIKGDSEDSPMAKKLKAQYNAIPEQAIERANIARAVAYLIDAAICIGYYQPIQGGMSNLGLVIGAGAWDYIEWSKIGAIVATLFAVEAVYWAYKLVTGIVVTHFQNN